MGRLEELYRVLEGSGIAAWQLQACSPMGNAARGLDWRIDPAEVIAFVMRHRAEAPFMLGAADNVGYFTDEELRLRGADGACFQGCRAGISAIGIDSAGNVRGCESLYDERFNEGNLRQRILRIGRQLAYIISLILQANQEIVERWNHFHSRSGKCILTRALEVEDGDALAAVALVYLMLSTGIRISECVGIDIDDIDWEENSVYLERKGRKFQNVYFDKKCAELLSAYMDEREDMDLDEPTTALFISRNGTRITPRSVQRMVKKYASVAVKNKHITPHKLRSTYATGIYNSTGDIYLAQNALGHKSVNTTARYANVSDEKRREASTAAENWLSNVTNGMIKNKNLQQ